MKYYLTVDVGGTKVAYGIFDEQRNLIIKDKRPADTNWTPDAFADALAADCEDLIKKSGLSRGDIAGVGLIVPGYVDFRTGEVHIITNIPKLVCFYPGRDLEKRLNLPVLLENDANAAGLAEARVGAGREYSDIVYMTVSTGIGGGIVINDAIFHGSYGAAGEIGHLLITPGQGALCGCHNRGCFESWCSAANMRHHLEQDIASGVSDSFISERGGLEKMDGRLLEEGVRAGDPLCVRQLDRMGDYLGILCYNIYQVLNINCYIIGGGLSNMGELLLSRIERSFCSWNNNSVFPVYFERAKLSGDIGLYGALELFLTKK